MRGRTLILAGVAAILPAIAAFPESGAAIGATATAFAPPQTPMVLTRTVWRTLYDGKEIVSRRRYNVQIRPDGTGFEVTGELIDSVVDAPPQLAVLAEMERRRPETTLFPLQLDAGGRILAIPGAVDAAARDQGAQAAQQLVQASQIATPDKEQAASLIDQIAGAGGTARWPADLFNPARLLQQDRRRIALPGGGEGEITVSIAVHGQLHGGLPRMTERTVVTALEGTRKTTREQWVLEPDTPAHH